VAYSIQIIVIVAYSIQIIVIVAYSIQIFAFSCEIMGIKTVDRRINKLWFNKLRFNSMPKNP